MKTFKDTEGREWIVRIDVSAIKRVRSLLDVDLLTVAEGDPEEDLLQQFINDPIMLCDVIYCLCKPEADKRDVSDEQFGGGMAGDAIEHATNALLEELVEFFPLAKRRLLGKALKKFETLKAKVFEAAEKRLDSPELEAELLEAALKESPEKENLKELMRGSSSGGSPASSESTPAP